jgi:hypothetical protein
MQGGKTSPSTIYPNVRGLINAGLNASASGVKAGIPDLPVSGFPKRLDFAVSVGPI